MEKVKFGHQYSALHRVATEDKSGGNLLRCAEAHHQTIREGLILYSLLTFPLYLVAKANPTIPVSVGGPGACRWLLLPSSPCFRKTSGQSKSLCD